MTIFNRLWLVSNLALAIMVAYPASAQQGCSSANRTVYSNGAVDGHTYAYIITEGFVVSDSFVIPGSAPIAVHSICYTVWVERGDVPNTVDWSITSGPNSGTVFAEGSDEFTAWFFLFNNGTNNGGVLECIDGVQPVGCDVWQVTLGYGLSAFPLTLVPGTYYLNLQNSRTVEGMPALWDQNTGKNCFSPACPSTAFFDSSSSIPSETFVIQ